ncbi:hypothetical protein BKA66DRAFT_516708 [Pyrenochaeta sp. MPI-SDFR-AT-0127]|nr:hypothetical protein BKA66DRAFT_516708 [Pyrenochaeta sp. MPI-SDFR-AT-0127]
MALVTRFLVHKHTKPTTATEEVDVTDGSLESQQQLAHISSSWKRLLSPRQNKSKGHWVPTLSGIIEAGDEGLFSSALFTSLHGHPGDIPLEVLYDAFATALRARSMAERSAYSGDISKFLAGTKRGPTSGLGRAKSVSYRTPSGRVDASTKAKRRSLDLSVAEMGLARGLSVKKPMPALVPMDKPRVAQGSWMKSGQTAQYHDGRLAVKITTAELLSLSIVLGTPLKASAENDKASRGAFGISISTAPIGNGKHQVTLRQHKRSIAQQHALGTGFSLLFAKHIAAGSLPYSQDKNVVNSLLITNDTFEAIQAGASLYTKACSSKSQRSRILTSLPSSRELSFHILAASTEQHPSTTLIDAIAELPFSGGLTPLSSAPLINTVRFIASGGLSPARLLQRLDGLVDKVHRQTPHLNIFGPLYEPQHAGLLYRERERLGKLATHTNTLDTLADKVARMTRYVTLIERLMALVPDMKPQDVLVAVRSATKTELRKSYADAVAAHNSPLDTPTTTDSHGCPNSDMRSKRQSTGSRTSARRSDRSSMSSTLTDNSEASPASSADFLPYNLGKQIENVLKSEIPLSIQTIALVARMVIVAWTLSVETVAWEVGESGFRVPDVQSLGEKMILC